MTRRESIIGLCMLCALAISALAAQSASAVFTGTTAYTCVKVAQPGSETTKGFSDEHCKTKAANDKTHLENVKYEHKEIKNDETTELKVTNITTGVERLSFVFNMTIAGVELEGRASEVEGTGTVHNHLEGEEHQTTGTAALVFKGVKVPKPAGAGGEKCVINTDDGTGTPGAQGVIDKTLKATSKGQGDRLKFEPDSENADAPFATFWIQQNPANLEKCPAALIKTWSLTGSFISTAIEGATIRFTSADTTAQGTLKLGSTEGPKIGIDGSLTLSARVNPGEAYTQLSVTTTGQG